MPAATDPAAAAAAETPAAPAAVSAAEPRTVEASPAPSGRPATDVVVDRWFAECVQGTVIGRYTDAYNTLLSALAELKARLNQET